MDEKRILKIIDAIRSIGEGNFNGNVSFPGTDPISKLGQTVTEMAVLIEKQFCQLKKLLEISHEINSGLGLDEILNHTYDSFKSVIPYDRIGLALLEDNDCIVRSRWVRSEIQIIKIDKGYAGLLKGSSLEKIIETGEPRILNDLETYLHEHPQSDATKRIVEEGMRSSLTCPLVAMGKRVGFLFFSSKQKNTYQDSHKDFFRALASQVSTIIEKGLLYEKILLLDKFKTKFLMIATHDLSNPLTVLKQCVSMFSDGMLGKVNDEQKGYLDMMKRSSEQMLHLTDDLLNVSVMESGNMRIKRNKTELSEHLKKSCELNSVIANAKSIALKTNIPEVLPEVYVDRERIEQVINNLLSNAIKYSNPGTTVTLSALVLDGGIKVDVCDQGPGIPENEFDKLFTLFSVTSNTPTSAKDRSTGLGLAISKYIVEAHGGTITARNNEKGRGGSTFSFFLPVRSH